MFGSPADDRPYDKPWLYKVSLDTRDRQCIAPTLVDSNRRCRVTTTDLAEVVRLTKAISRSRDPREIYLYSRDLVLLRCCDFRHKIKLGAEPECHDKLTDDYIAAFWKQQLISVRVPQGLRVHNGDRVEPDSMIPYHTELDMGLTIQSDVDLTPKNKGGRPLPTLGVLYILTLPSRPGILKIGYTSRSTRTRCLEWSECFPGAVVAFEKPVAYPERMEALVHLELQQLRRQIAKCAVCEKGHIEFFQSTVDIAKGVILDWCELVSKSPLYDDTLRLKDNWRLILKTISGEVTARALLDGLLLADEDIAAGELITTEVTADAITLKKEEATVETIAIKIERDTDDESTAIPGSLVSAQRSGQTETKSLSAEPKALQPADRSEEQGSLSTAILPNMRDDDITSGTKPQRIEPKASQTSDHSDKKDFPSAAILPNKRDVESSAETSSQQLNLDLDEKLHSAEAVSPSQVSTDKPVKLETDICKLVDGLEKSVIDQLPTKEERILARPTTRSSRPVPVPMPA